MKIFAVLSIVLFHLSQITAQNIRPLGLEIDDSEYASIALQSENLQSNSGRKSIPTQIDLTPFCPTPQDQGELSSCVGWAAGYGAMTIEQALQNKWTDQKEIDENASAALFIYNQLAKDDCAGVRMPLALDMLNQNGNCRSRDFDFEMTDCTTEVPPSLIEDAKSNRIEDYIRLFEIKETPTDKNKTVKQLLAQLKPVIVGMHVLNNFYALEDGDQSWIPTIGDQTYAGGHAMVVVGYDDNKFDRPNQAIAPSMRGAFKVMNSWGNTWGDDGFIWIRYAHFGKHCRHAYAIQLPGAEPVDLTEETEIAPVHANVHRTLQGSFRFNVFTGVFNGDQPLFKEQPLQRTEQGYLLADRSVGEYFQIEATDLSTDGFVYVFSIDAHGKAEVHYPKNDTYGVAQNIGELIIPSKETQLQITKEGTDHLVVIYSESKIKSEYLEKLSSHLVDVTDISNELSRILGKYTVPDSDIQYDDVRMGFKGKTGAEGKMVAMVLRIET